MAWIHAMAFGTLAVLFIVFPEMDLWVSRLFAHPVHMFFPNHTPIIVFIYHTVEVLSVGLSLGLLISLAITWRMKRPVFGFSSKKLLYLLVVLAVGPGIVVNLISKNSWGRARPRYIEQFGGEQKFTPAFVFSDQCDRNCSFVSGHAAFGFYFVSFAFILTRHRKKAFAAAVGYGTIVGFGRIYQGGHFLSDVIFAYFYVYFTAWGIYYLMFEKKIRKTTT